MDRAVSEGSCDGDSVWPADQHAAEGLTVLLDFEVCFAKGPISACIRRTHLPVAAQVGLRGTRPNHPEEKEKKKSKENR
jgi:hypothetical protein